MTRLAELAQPCEESASITAETCQAFLPIHESMTSHPRDAERERRRNADLMSERSQVPCVLSLGCVTRMTPRIFPLFNSEPESTGGFLGISSFQPHTIEPQGHVKLTSIYHPQWQRHSSRRLMPRSGPIPGPTTFARRVSLSKEGTLGSRSISKLTGSDARRFLGAGFQLHYPSRGHSRYAEKP